jgi:glycosyltransferase 2 family protein
MGAACLYLAIRHVSLKQMVAVLTSARTGWLALAVIIYWLELGVRVVRWSALLSHTGQTVPLGSATSAFIVGYAANNVLPAKLGEVVRVDLISRLSDIPRMASLGTVVIERIFDILFILLMAAIGIGFMVLPETADLLRLRNGMTILGIVAVLVSITGILLGRVSVSSRWGLGSVAHARLMNLVRGVRILGNPRECGRVLALSLLIWILNGITMWLIVFGLGLNLTLLQTLLLMGVSGLAAALPAPPAGLGVLQYAFFLVFDLLGKPSAIGLVASTIVQVALLSGVTLVGAVIFFTIVIPAPAEPRAMNG